MNAQPITYTHNGKQYVSIQVVMTCDPIDEQRQESSCAARSLSYS